MRTTWSADTPDLFCASQGAPWGTRRHLVVEALPEGGWDWVAWSSEGHRLVGRAETLAHAMSAAEHAGRQLAGPTPSPTPPLGCLQSPMPCTI